MVVGSKERFMIGIDYVLVLWEGIVGNKDRCGGGRGGREGGRINNM